MPKSKSVDPVSRSAYPSFRRVTRFAPSMPPAWRAVALLQPFSPPLSKDPKPDNPFFQLCVANIAYVQGQFFSAQVSGCSYGSWWYFITPTGTELSTDLGRTWTTVDMGWTLPSNWFGGQRSQATCAGSSPLNWMSKRRVEWWKVPVPLKDSPPAATWMWFDVGTSRPVRMMFGYGPPKPSMGDPTQLAFFQMYSFTYFPSFRIYVGSGVPDRPTKWARPSFSGFAVGNPNGYKSFVWNKNFGMTVFLTPVNEKFNPLPTRFLYIWKPDSDYSVYSDRAQDTLMLYTYNPGNSQNLEAQEALLTGPAPSGTIPPPDSATGFLINRYTGGSQSCIGGGRFPLPQEPPDWISIPEVDAKIHATITNNRAVAPGAIVTVYSVLFPPAPPNYPEATYLWTWYAPMASADGARSRPITFMQSMSGVDVGTSLALADYFYYEEFGDPIDPANFDIPDACSGQIRKIDLRRRLL